MPAEYLAKIRRQYPQYAHIPDAELARLIIAKYPQYQGVLGDVASGARPQVAPPIRPGVPSPTPPATPPATGPLAGTERVAGAITGAIETISGAPERFIAGPGGYPEFFRRGGVPAVLAHEWSPLVVATRMATDPIALVTAGLGTALRVARPAAAGLQTVMRGGVAVPAVQLAGRTLTPAQAQAERIALAAHEAATIRPGPRALPAPGQTYRPPIVTPPPVPVEITLLNAQRAENLAMGMLPPHLRQPALLPGLTRQRAPSPPGMFSRMERSTASTAGLAVRQGVREGLDTHPLTATPKAPDGSPERIISAGAPQRASPFFDASPKILDKVLGEGLGSRLLTVRTLEEGLVGTRYQTLRQGQLLRLTPEEDLNLFRVLEGRAQPVTRRVATLAQAFRQMATEDAADYLARGMKVRVDAVYDTTTGARLREPQWREFKPIEQYAPRMLDPDKVARMNPQALTQAIMRANPDLPPNVASDLAVGLRARVFRQPLPATVGEDAARLLRLGEHVPPHLHARAAWRLPDEIIRPMKEALPIYVRDAARERAILRVYGPGDALIEAAIKRVQDTGHPDARLAVEAWDRFRGRNVDSPGAEAVGQIGRIARNVTTTMFLGIPTAVKQLSQLGPGFAKLPVRSFFAGFAKAFSRGGWFDAERAGAFVDDLYRDAVALRPSFLTATRLDVVERVTGRAASEVVTRTGISRLDQFARVTAYHGAMHDLDTMRRAAIAGNAQAAAQLRRYGLSASSTVDELQRVAKEFADKVNIRAGELDMPYILTTPGFSWARHLNSFAIGMTKLMWNDFLRPALAGNPKPLFKLLAAGTVTGEAIGTAILNLQGRPDDRPGGGFIEFIQDLHRGVVPTKTVLMRFADDLAYTGVIGIIQNLWHAAIRSGSTPEQASRAIVSTVGGAAASNAAELAGHALVLGQAMVSGDPKHRDRALRQTERAVVRRVPIVGGLAGPRISTEFQDRRRATNAIARAIRRGDQAEVNRWYAWFRERHPDKDISEASVKKALQ